MKQYPLNYGGTPLTLTQSSRLIGVRATRGGRETSLAMVGLALPGRAWHAAGELGGFQVIELAEDDDGLDDALDRIRQSSSVALGTHVFEAANGAATFVPTGDLFIEFGPNATESEIQAVIDQYHLVLKEAREGQAYVLGVTARSPNPVKIAAALQDHKGVKLAEPELASRQRAASPLLVTDPLLRDQWHLRNTGHHRGTRVGFRKGADARVWDAWELARTLGSDTVTVAVIDDGFDLGHPDLSTSGKLVHPWDFTRRGPDPRPGPGDWHGTACAGVAVAASGQGGVVGAAAGCRLMPLRWGPDLSDRQVEAWFGWATAQGADVVSCSWGAANPFFPLSTRAQRAISNCATQGRGGRGCVIVFAAGNESADVNAPAQGSVAGFAIHPSVIAVAASTSRDQRSDYSNFGREISVCAPSSGAGGWGILTSDVRGVDPETATALGYADGDFDSDFGGTSSACPLVAGVAALVLSVNPDLTAAEVKALLQRTARRIGPKSAYDANGHSPHFGHGCVNARAAVAEATAGLAAAPAKKPARRRKASGKAAAGA
jgi:subtilisin family serine protease